VEKGKGIVTVKEPLTIALYRSHLEGKERLGIFPVVGGRAKLGCIDLDSDRPEHARALYAPCERLGVRAKLARLSLFGEQSGKFDVVLSRKWL
jgi:hypothetical protein